MLQSNAPHRAITEYFVSKLERGIVPWQIPWSEAPCNFCDGCEYDGISAFVLSTAGYESSQWISMSQLGARDAKAKEGETPYPTLRWNYPDRRRKNGWHSLEWVYNLDQCEGIRASHRESNPPTPFNPRAAEYIVEYMSNAPHIWKHFSENSYSTDTDGIFIVDKARYQDPSLHYSILFELLVRSTGHPKRLNRKGIKKRYEIPQDYRYSIEDMTGEMGSTLLCNACGIRSPIPAKSWNVHKWIEKLSVTPKMPVIAARQAGEAVRYIMNNDSEIYAQ